MRDVLFRQMDLWNFGQPLPQLFKSQLSVSILVHLAEGQPKLLDLVLWNPGGNEAEGGSLELN